MLRDRGITYPDTTGSNVGNGTPAAFALLGETPAYFRASHPTYDAPHLDVEACWRELVERVEPGTALLVSSEELGAVPPSELARATAWDGHEKRIFVYLRRQDLAIEASYKQEVWAGLFSGSVDDYVHDAVVEQNPARGCFDYRRLLTELWETFGRGNVSVFVYEEDRDPAWLLETALGVLGLELDGAFQVPRTLNQSLHPLFIEYLRRALVDGTSSDDLVLRVTALAGDTTLTAGLPRGVLSKDARASIRAHFAEDNAWLAGELGGLPPTLFAEGRRSDPEAFVPDQHEERFEQVARAVTSR